MKITIRLFILTTAIVALVTWGVVHIYKGSDERFVQRCKSFVGKELRCALEDRELSRYKYTIIDEPPGTPTGITIYKRDRFEVMLYFKPQHDLFNEEFDWDIDELEHCTISWIKVRNFKVREYRVPP